MHHACMQPSLDNTECHTWLAHHSNDRMQQPLTLPSVLAYLKDSHRHHLTHQMLHACQHVNSHHCPSPTVRIHPDRHSEHPKTHLQTNPHTTFVSFCCIAAQYAQPRQACRHTFQQPPTNGKGDVNRSRQHTNTMWP